MLRCPRFGFDEVSELGEPLVSAGIGVDDD